MSDRKRSPSPDRSERFWRLIETSGGLAALWIGAASVQGQAPLATTFFCSFGAGAAKYAAGKDPDAIAVGDYNGDGHADLAVSNDLSDDVSVLLGNGDGTFQAAVNYGVGGAPQGVAAGDFDGDGDLDLAVTSWSRNDVSILLGNGDGIFQAAVSYAVGEDPYGAAVGDFNADGKPDLAVANFRSHGVSILLGNGDGTFQVAVAYAAGEKPASIAVGDYDGDGHLDFAVANYGSHDVGIHLGNGDGTFQAAVSYGAGGSPGSGAVIGAGDFNGDGRLDLAVANWDSQNVSILLGNGDGTFQAAVNYASGGTPVAEVVGDFNGDGDLDLAVANRFSGNLSILLGNGDGTFQAAVNCGISAGPWWVTAGDFNGDGRLDLAVANGDPINDVSILLNPPPTLRSRPVLSRRRPCTDAPVTTTIADVDPAGNAYTISSDGLGSYFNGTDYVTSILTCNGYNGIKKGDWQFNKPVSDENGQRLNARKLGVNLNVSDAVQPDDPHYTAPANPPFWGAEIRYAYSEVKCTLLNRSMLTMTAGTAMTCPMIFSFFTASDAQYGLNPAHSFNNFPENTDVQVSCNATNSGGCTDWFIEPIGSLQAVGRLVPNADSSNQGDFYMRFKIHVTRP